VTSTSVITAGWEQDHMLLHKEHTRLVLIKINISPYLFRGKTCRGQTHVHACQKDHQK